MRVATAIYRVMLQLFPKSFQEIFAEEMLGVFFTTIAHARNRSFLAFLFTCLREFLDLPFNIIHEQWLHIQEEFQMEHNHHPLFGKPGISTLLIGVIGGISLIVTVNSTTRGPAIFLPYTVLMLAAIPGIKLNYIQDFKHRLAAGISIFMIATVILYVYIAVIINPGGTALWMSEYSLFRNLWEHIWRLGLMFLIGTPISLLVAQLSRPKQPELNV